MTSLFYIFFYFLKFNGFGNRFEQDFMFELQSFFFPSSASPKIFSLPTVFVCLLSAQSAVRFCPAAAAAVSLRPCAVLSVGYTKEGARPKNEELFRGDETT